MFKKRKKIKWKLEQYLLSETKISFLDVEAAQFKIKMTSEEIGSKDYLEAAHWTLTSTHHGGETVKMRIKEKFAQLNHHSVDEETKNQ
jgi:hypothetical protein